MTDHLCFDCMFYAVPDPLTAVTIADGNAVCQVHADTRVRERKQQLELKYGPVAGFMRLPPAAWR